ncbi:MAG: DUF1232 domain-containing protein [Myxococcota bacterium]|nr:DUF1232 domain-containing protein [Myxococcota bacterium]
MRIVLDLSDKDVRYFRKALQEVKKRKGAAKEDLVIEAAHQLIAEVAAAEAPQFVQERFQELGRLVEMLEDERWGLGPPERTQVLTLLAYFVDPDDEIPDSIPGLGYLDDAIMVYLALQELQPELEAYEKFCQVKGSAEAVAKKREQLVTRMRTKKQSERERRRLMQRGKKGVLGLW